jgi:hypothetical protein
MGAYDPHGRNCTFPLAGHGLIILILLIDPVKRSAAISPYGREITCVPPLI